MKIFKSTFFALFIACAALTCVTLGQSASPGDLPGDFVKAWNSHDMKSFERLFAADAVWVPVAEVMEEGRPAILKDLGEAHSTWAKTITVGLLGKTTVRRLRPDTAVIFFHMAMSDENGKQIPDIERAMVFVTMKKPDGWRIVAGQLTKQNPPQ